jgi:hypothetical protein
LIDEASSWNHPCGINVQNLVNAELNKIQTILGLQSVLDMLIYSVEMCRNTTVLRCGGDIPDFECSDVNTKNLICTVCQNPMLYYFPFVVTNCAHVFHRTCYLQKTFFTCPNCRVNPVIIRHEWTYVPPVYDDNFI